MNTGLGLRPLWGEGGPGSLGHRPSSLHQEHMKTGWDSNAGPEPRPGILLRQGPSQASLQLSSNT